MNRRLAIVLAALVIPGGFFALFGAAVVKAISRTETGRRAWDRMAMRWRRPALAVQPLRQAA